MRGAMRWVAISRLGNTTQAWRNLPFKPVQLNARIVRLSEGRPGLSETRLLHPGYPRALTTGRCSTTPRLGVPSSGLKFLGEARAVAAPRFADTRRGSAATCCKLGAGAAHAGEHEERPLRRNTVEQRH